MPFSVYFFIVSSPLLTMIFCNIELLFILKFLLGEGMEYVLTERFCQDTLEEYFGNQRKLGRRSDNPDV